MRMQHTIPAPKEFWLGLIYLFIGAGGIWHALGYPMGTADRMGPGYLPSVISGLMLLFGAVSLIRAVKLSGEPIGRIDFRALLCVLAGVLAFGILAERAGLVMALAALVLTSAAASPQFGFQWSAILGLIGFIAFCALVFIKGLGVPLPLLGRWFGG
jgi:Tripartite tricarboxylate transporter TctB family